MAKFFNLNSQRTSHDQMEGLPARRFTDTQIKTGQSRAVETIYRLQKNAYFQGLLNKDHGGSQHTPDDKSSKVFKSLSKPLDMVVFTRKNAVLLESNARPSMSPRHTNGSKAVESLPAFSRPNNRKISLASVKADSKVKENLKQKVIELEKKLKNFEKISKTMRVENSGEKLEKKKSVKKIAHPFTASQMTQILMSKAGRASPRGDLDSSNAERPSRQGLRTFTSISKIEGDLTPRKLTKYAKPDSVQCELAKLRDRLSNAITRDLAILKIVNQSSQK